MSSNTTSIHLGSTSIGTCSTIYSKSFVRRFQLVHETIGFRKFPLRRNLSRQFQLYGCLLITVLLLGTSTSNPINGSCSKLEASLKNAGEYWTAPCGSSSSSGELNVPNSAPEISTSHLLTVALLAKQQLEKFRENYANKTFKMNLSDLYKTHQTHYAWLTKDMEIPDDPNEPVPSERLNTLLLNCESKKIFAILQRLAIAFEQLLIDQCRDNADFFEDFKNVSHNLNEMICTVKDLVDESQNESRSIMDESVRHMSHVTHKRMRDWYIFRDYMYVVEYIIQVMQYFTNKNEQNESTMV